jgi:MoaA/NifB/PqqE/SkfB family radical SAM enzyme
MRTSEIIIVRLSSSCSKKCKHCYYSAKNETGCGNLLSRELFARFCRELRSAGICEVNLEGEHPAIHELLRDIRDAGLRATSSAATELLNPILLQDVNDVLRQVNFSVVSPDPDIHDAIQGVAGDHSDTLANMELCHRHEIATFHWVAVSNENSHCIEQHIRFCKDVGSVGLAFLYVSPFGNADASMCVEPDEWFRACKQIKALRSHYPELRIHFEPVYLKTEDLAAKACKCLTKDLVFIDSDGTAYPCPALAAQKDKTYSFGNIGCDDVIALLRNGWSLASPEVKPHPMDACPADKGGEGFPPSTMKRICPMYWNRGD